MKKTRDILDRPRKSIQRATVVQAESKEIGPYGLIVTHQIHCSTGLLVIVREAIIASCRAFAAMDRTVVGHRGPYATGCSDSKHLTGTMWGERVQWNNVLLHNS